ncbi:hypothetical protein C8R44DRAFT_815197, partial [Mycena epipterygia]
DGRVTHSLATFFDSAPFPAPLRLHIPPPSSAAYASIHPTPPQPRPVAHIQGLYPSQGCWSPHLDIQDAGTLGFWARTGTWTGVESRRRSRKLRGTDSFPHRTALAPAFWCRSSSGGGDAALAGVQELRREGLGLGPYSSPYNGVHVLAANPIRPRASVIKIRVHLRIQRLDFWRWWDACSGARPRSDAENWDRADVELDGRSDGARLRMGTRELGRSMKPEHGGMSPASIWVAADSEVQDAHIFPGSFLDIHAVGHERELLGETWFFLAIRPSRPANQQRRK